MSHTRGPLSVPRKRGMAHAGCSGYGRVCDEALLLTLQLEYGAHPYFTDRRTDFRLFLDKEHFHSVDSLSRPFWTGVGTTPENTVSIHPSRTSLGQQKKLCFLNCIEITLKAKEQFLDGGLLTPQGRGRTAGEDGGRRGGGAEKCGSVDSWQDSYHTVKDLEVHRLSKPH